MKQQCNGITKKGVRCGIMVNGGWCHHHVMQNTNLINNNQKTTNAKSHNNTLRACSNITSKISSNNITPKTSSNITPKTSSNITPKTSSSNITPKTSSNNLIPRSPHKSVLISPQNTPKTNYYNPVHPSKPGFIYIYTLTSLLENKPIQVKNLPNAHNRHRDKWVSYEPKKSHYYLLKIGMTTGTVTRRLKQWETKCNHQLTCIFPAGKQNSMDKFVDKFLKLKLSRTEVKRTDNSIKLTSRTIETTKNIGTESLRTFPTSHSKESLSCFRDNGFYAEADVAQVESLVHKNLRKLYGDGSLYCTGCQGKKTGEGPFNEYSIHTEWFLVPKNELAVVYKVINDECEKKRKHRGA